MAVPFVAVHAGKCNIVLQSKDLRQFSSCCPESTGTGRLIAMFLYVYVLFIRSLNPSPSILFLLRSFSHFCYLPLQVLAVIMNQQVGN